MSILPKPPDRVAELRRIARAVLRAQHDRRSSIVMIVAYAVVATGGGALVLALDRPVDRSTIAAVALLLVVCAFSIGVFVRQLPRGDR